MYFWPKSLYSTCWGEDPVVAVEDDEHEEEEDFVSQPKDEDETWDDIKIDQFRIELDEEEEDDISQCTIIH